MPTPSDANEGGLLLIIPARCSPSDDDDREDNEITLDISGGGDFHDGATVYQTSLNVTKICMGTGTLALPYASEVGGLLFNALGLLVICGWNYYSANCLLRCLEYLPNVEDDVEDRIGGGDDDPYDDDEFVDDYDDDDIAIRPRLTVGRMGDVRLGYGTNDIVDHRTTLETTQGRRRRRRRRDDLKMMPPPPPGSTAFGRVAWYSLGPMGTNTGFPFISFFSAQINERPVFRSPRDTFQGLMVLDLLMLSLYIGLLIGGCINWLQLCTFIKIHHSL